MTTNKYAHIATFLNSPNYHEYTTDAWKRAFLTEKALFDEMPSNERLEAVTQIWGPENVSYAKDSEGWSPITRTCENEGIRNLLAGFSPEEHDIAITAFNAHGKNALMNCHCEADFNELLGKSSDSWGALNAKDAKFGKYSALEIIIALHISETYLCSSRGSRYFPTERLPGLIKAVNESVGGKILNMAMAPTPVQWGSAEPGLNRNFSRAANFTPPYLMTPTELHAHITKGITPAPDTCKADMF